MQLNQRTILSINNNNNNKICKYFTISVQIVLNSHQQTIKATSPSQLVELRPSRRRLQSRTGSRSILTPEALALQNDKISQRERELVCHFRRLHKKRSIVTENTYSSF